MTQKELSAPPESQPGIRLFAWIKDSPGKAGFLFFWLLALIGMIAFVGWDGARDEIARNTNNHNVSDFLVFAYFIMVPPLYSAIACIVVGIAFFAVGLVVVAAREIFNGLKSGELIKGLPKALGLVFFWVLAFTLYSGVGFLLTMAYGYLFIFLGSEGGQLISGLSMILGYASTMGLLLAAFGWAENSRT
jgi:hypothetical protein